MDKDKSCYACKHATYHPGGYRVIEGAWFYCAQEDESLPASVVDRDIAEGSDGCPCWTPAEQPTTGGV